MFELPECVTLAGQINETLTGKTIRTGSLGSTPHRFVWYNKSHDEFERLTKAKIIGEARAKGKWLFIPLEPGYVLLLGVGYFSTLIDSLTTGEKRSVKGLLTQEQLVPGLGNAIAQDILFRAGLHPRHPIEDLNKGQRRKLYNAALKTVREAIKAAATTSMTCTASPEDTFA
jgi:formamidopyrimidine-DNA glycosylase